MSQFVTGKEVKVSIYQQFWAKKICRKHLQTVNVIDFKENIFLLEYFYADSEGCVWHILIYRTVSPIFKKVLKLLYWNKLYEKHSVELSVKISNT